MLDAHRLRVFGAVVASGSVQAAAAHLGYTPSTVSQHVAALQRETGLTLMTRVGRGVEPTAAGLEIARLTGPVVESLSAVERRVRDLREGRSGSLTVHSFASASTQWMPTVIKTVSEEFPEVSLSLALVETPPTTASDAADLQLVVADDAYAPPAGLRAERLLTEPYVAVVSADHELASRDEVDLVDLSGYVWVSNDAPENYCARNLATACAAAGFAPTYGIETLDHHAAIALVATGVGITVVPRLCASALPDGVRVLGLTHPTPTRTIYALTTAAEGSPPLRRALGVLRGCAAESRDAHLP